MNALGVAAVALRAWADALDQFGQDVAARYDHDEAEMFYPEVV